MLAVVVVLATATLFGQGRPLLDVPYVAQTPELCGGAAVSMVMRYWGARDVVPEDFQSLVVPAERGIPTTDLTAAVQSRRWQTVVGPDVTEAAWLRLEQDISRGRPVIALIEVAADTYHYVVVVGLTADQVVWHDPARSPFRVMPREGFERAWAAARHWSLLILPPEDVTPIPATPAPAPVSGAAPATPCTGLVARGVDLALAGQTADAEANLLAATGLCPLDPAAWRELSGLRFTQKDWSGAARLAAVAVRLDSTDAHARQLLATSRFLLGDLPGALNAWTPLGEPRVDAIAVTGADRTNHPLVIRASGLKARRLLTGESLQRAERRVADLPVVSRARVSFAPAADGLADVEIAIVERDLWPGGWVPLGVLGARALVSDEARIDVHGALGQGERFGVAWRWKPARPSVAFGAAFPAPAWLPGIVAFDALWERQTYAMAGPGPNGEREQDRRRLVIGLSDWATSRLQWHVRAGTDRFDRRAHATGDAGLEVRLAGDRVAVSASGQGWLPSGAGERFGAARAAVAFRSTSASRRPAWFFTTAVEAATTQAPLAVWPAAGTGGRGSLLRAHPLLEADVVAGPLFGRRVSTSTLEYWRPIRDVFGQGLYLAAFSDAARAWHRLDRPGASRLYLDAGLGVRLTTFGGTLRADVARGVRGGGTTWSAGFMAAWPRIY